MLDCGRYLGRQYRAWGNRTIPADLTFMAIHKGRCAHTAEIDLETNPVCPKRIRWRRLSSRLSFLGAACALMTAPVLHAQRAKPTDYEVKAAYLYNFGKFVTWPQPPKDQPVPSQFKLCIMGKDPFGPSLDAIVGDETVDGAKVVVKRIANAHDATSCKIVFISYSEADHMKNILEELASASVLTVSDISGFADSGGMIEFVIAERRVRFEVNLPPAQHAGLALSSELLKVAANVRKPPTPGGH